MRYAIISNDEGMTFTGGRYEKNLIEPTKQACQGSLLTIPQAATTKFQNETFALFANPATVHEKRSNMRIAVSVDNCSTWMPGKVVHAGPAAYSDMAFTDDGLITLVYERGDKEPYETIAVDQINLAWLLGNSTLTV